MRKSTKSRHHKRDRRKAKQSRFARGASPNDSRKGHHLYDSPAPERGDVAPKTMPYFPKKAKKRKKNKFEAM